MNGFVAMREEQFARLVAALAEVHIERSGQKILTGILIYDGLYRITVTIFLSFFSQV